MSDDIATEEQIEGLYTEIDSYQKEHEHTVFKQQYFLKKKRVSESEMECAVTIEIAERMRAEGYIINSKSGIAIPRHNDLLSDSYFRICDQSHAGDFDLLVLGEDWTKIGVEVKPILTRQAFQLAVGQCVTRLANNSLIDSAIIYAKKIADKKTAEYIHKTIGYLHLPIIVKTLE